VATNFPASSDDSTSLPNPTAVSKTNSPSLGSGQTNQNDAIKAIEAKLGTGASTPTNNTFLIGNGTGTSAFSTLTSAQLSARLSDETGTGSAVFATTPTLVTPKVDTINENTPANGVTIDGLNIKDSKLTTSNSVVTANITDASVSASKLNTGAQTAYVPTSETTTSTSFVDLTTITDSVTVNVGANGLLLVALYAQFSNSGTGATYVSFVLSGANTQAAADAYSILTSGTANAQFNISSVFLLNALSVGSTVVKMKYKVQSGTGTFTNRRISVIPL